MDAIFILNSLIERHLNNRKRFYCFDSVYRNGLWYKLIKSGVNGLLLFAWLSLVVSVVVSFVLSFFPRGVLDEILNLIESVSGGFPSYS